MTSGHMTMQVLLRDSRNRQKEKRNKNKYRRITESRIKLVLHYHNRERTETVTVRAPFPWPADRSRNRWRVQKSPEEKGKRVSRPSLSLWAFLGLHISARQSVRRAALVEQSEHTERSIKMFAGDHRVSESPLFSNWMTICSDTISWPKQNIIGQKRYKRAEDSYNPKLAAISVSRAFCISQISRQIISTIDMLIPQCCCMALVLVSLGCKLPLEITTSRRMTVTGCVDPAASAVALAPSCAQSVRVSNRSKSASEAVCGRVHHIHTE